MTAPIPSEPLRDRGETAVSVLVVCTANRCRSPMAAGLLSARLAERGVAAGVASAGFGPEGLPAVPEAVAVMADAGIDISPHRSQRVTPALCQEAGVVIGMTRQHLIDLVLLAPQCWSRMFPLLDLVRRGRQIGPLDAGAGVDEWVRRAHGGRTRSGVLAMGAGDDIADPIGRPRAEFERTRDRLDSLLSELAGLLAPR